MVQAVDKPREIGREFSSAAKIINAGETVIRAEAYCAQTGSHAFAELADDPRFGPWEPTPPELATGQISVANVGPAFLGQSQQKFD